MHASRPRYVQAVLSPGCPVVDLVAGEVLSPPLPVSSVPVIEATVDDVLEAVGADGVCYMVRALAASRLTRTALEILFPPYGSERWETVSAQGLNFASYGREIAPGVARFLIEEHAGARIVEAAGAKRNGGDPELQIKAARDAARGKRRRQPREGRT